VAVATEDDEMANVAYRPMNGVSTCTCGKRVDIMGWRYGETFRFFCSAEHAQKEGVKIDAQRQAEGLAPVRERP
jgi:hypothetical protein